MRSVEDVSALGAAMKNVAGAIQGPLVICGDYRETSLLSQPTADAFLSMFSTFNPRIERSGVLLSAKHATFNLQVERIVREAGKPSRRTFRVPSEFAAWLGEVLSADERTALARVIETASAGETR
jgi:hypothetical protein